MTRITRITVASLAGLAIASPVAIAMPDPGAVWTSSLAGTTAQQDRRSADDGDASPLVSILPVAVLSLLVAAGMGHAVRMSGPACQPLAAVTTKRSTAKGN